MTNDEWANDLMVAVTVCDLEGCILYMNEKSKSTFSKDGGECLVGKNLFDCHSLASQNKIKTLMEKQSSNIYTIDKKGKKKMIIQTPWFKDSQIQGLVEFSVEIPNDMPHFNRD